MENLNVENARDLLVLLDKQIEVIDLVYENQKIIRSSILEKNWDELESASRKVNKYSEEFQGLDVMLHERLSLAKITTSSAFYAAANSIGKIDEQLSVALVTSYGTLRRKLIQSEVENKALTDYVRITNQFLQGVFDKVLPQRKNVLYSRKGVLVKNHPESIVVNTIM